MRTILGIDPGSRKTGFGVIKANLQKTEFITAGCISVASDDFSMRLADIFHGISNIIHEHQPDEVAIENVFLAKNASSALKLGQARGAAIVACVAKQLPVSTYSAREVKQAVVGRGAADKTQVQHMVSILLNLLTKPQADAADALAIALCHVHHQQTRIRFSRQLNKANKANISIPI